MLILFMMIDFNLTFSEIELNIYLESYGQWRTEGLYYPLARINCKQLTEIDF